MLTRHDVLLPGGVTKSHYTAAAMPLLISASANSALVVEQLCIVSLTLFNPVSQGQDNDTASQQGNMM